MPPLPPAPTYPVGGVLVMGEDGEYKLLHNLNEDESLVAVFKGDPTIAGTDLPRGVTFAAATDALEAFRDCTSLSSFNEGVTFASL